jgi:hypothetical protein
MPNTAETTAAELPEVLSWDEICLRYPNEWVILIHIVQRDFETVAGRVVGHGLDKHALLPVMREAGNVHRAVARFWTGHVRTWKFKSYVTRQD